MTKPTKPLRRAGKRGRAWDSARKKLKKQSVEMNIMFCEFRFPGCWNEIHGYSHPEKRRFIKPDDLTKNCVASCNFCHQIIENHPEKVELHAAAIARREEIIYSGV